MAKRPDCPPAACRVARAHGAVDKAASEARYANTKAAPGGGAATEDWRVCRGTLAPEPEIQLNTLIDHRLPAPTSAWLQVPLRESLQLDQEVTGVGRAQACQHARRQIVIVEDDRGCADFLVTWLRLACDLEVVGAAHSVADAKRVLTSTRPRLLLTDYRLPDGTGAEVTAFARHELGDV